MRTPTTYQITNLCAIAPHTHTRTSPTPRSPKPETQDPKPETRNPKPQDPRSEPRAPKRRARDEGTFCMALMVVHCAMPPSARQAPMMSVASCRTSRIDMICCQQPTHGAVSAPPRGPGFSISPAPSPADVGLIGCMHTHTNEPGPLRPVHHSPSPSWTGARRRRPRRRRNAC
jgi:hypothetical protein